MSRANICVECLHSFDEPKSWVEPHGERREGCPHCGGTFVNALYCDGCNKLIVSDYIKIKNQDVFCSDCYTEHSFDE